MQSLLLNRVSEIELLKNNQYVTNVTCKGITYEREFKKIFVLRSGYYRCWSTKAITSRVNMYDEEESRLFNIRNIFNQHKGKVGSKQINMILETDLKIIYNLKSIK